MKAGRIIARQIVRMLVKGATPVLRTLDQLLLRHYEARQFYPPVFIIGPPRSGTTLLYQILIDRYRFAYFTNFTANFYETPISAFWIAAKLFPDAQLGDYASRYGRTQGWRGPHECGAFWYRWFPRGEHVYVPPGTTPKAHLRELRREVIGMTRVARAPVLLKNTYNSMRIAPIMEAFPEACFLVCRRNPVDTAQSILKCRIEVHGNKQQWWSLPPKEIDEIKRHPYWEQVVEQIYYTYQQIEEDRRRFGEDCFHDVNYEHLCRNIHDTLSDIEQFLERRGINLDVRGHVPPQFPVSTGQKVSDDDYERIVQKVDELWG